MMVEQPVSRETLTCVPSTDPSATGILRDLSGDWHASATTGKRIPQSWQKAIMDEA